MSYLGEKKRSELVRFWLTLDAAPTGTPTITITRGQGTALDTPISAVNMTQGVSTLEWYYDYTSEAAAQVGLYIVKYIAVIDGVTRYAYDQYDQSINDADSIDIIVDAIKVRTDVIATATEDNTAHGAGSWQQAGTGNGLRAITFNIKDGDSNNVEGVNIAVHNAANDAAPVYASGQTDTDGNSAEFNLDDATYSVRLAKAGAIVGETETVVVTADATKNLTVASFTITPPADAGLCKLFFFPQNLSHIDVTDASVRVKTSTDLALVGGVYVDNRESLMVADTTTDPDNYYINAKIGTEVRIIGKIFGFNHTITVPDQSTLDLSTLITS